VEVDRDGEGPWADARVAVQWRETTISSDMNECWARVRTYLRNDAKAGSEGSLIIDAAREILGAGGDRAGDLCTMAWGCEPWGYRETPAAVTELLGAIKPPLLADPDRLLRLECQLVDHHDQAVAELQETFPSADPRNLSRALAALGRKDAVMRAQSEARGAAVEKMLEILSWPEGERPRLHELLVKHGSADAAVAAVLP